jgi:hypothetical protein
MEWLAVRVAVAKARGKQAVLELQTKDLLEVVFLVHLEQVQIL